MDPNLKIAVLLMVAFVIAAWGVIGVAERSEQRRMSEWDRQESERRRDCILRGRLFIPNPDPYRHLRRSAL